MMINFQPSSDWRGADVKKGTDVSFGGMGISGGMGVSRWDGRLARHKTGLCFSSMGVSPVTHSHRQGAIIVVVLMFVALLSVIATTTIYRIRGEVASSSIAGRNELAYAAAMSGIQQAMAIVSSTPDDPAMWLDNPDLFENQLVFESGGQQWFFTAYAFDPDDSTEPRFGVSDESARININTADEVTLLHLPGMTLELVDAFLDYRDPDDEPRPDGAEQDYYDQLDRPYLIRNGPLATVEELLMIRGFDGLIVYGEDANFNGLLDANESDGEVTFPPDNGDGALDRGLTDYLTALTTDPQIDSEGNARVPLGKGFQTLQDAGLPRNTLRFIYLAQQQGYEIKHPADLLNAEFESQGGRGGPTVIRSEVGANELPLVLDKLTVDENDTIGRVNVLTAPAVVLETLPGMDQNMAQQIVDARGGLSDESRMTFAWLYTQGIMDEQSFKEAAPYLTSRSYQYRVRVVGYGLPSRRYVVMEAVVDVTDVKKPRITYLRDITRRGLPFAIETDQGMMD